MAFDFPSSPTVGQSYTPAGGPTYVWDGSAWAQSDQVGPVLGFIRQQVITASGAITLHAETKAFLVEVQGAGGAGGGTGAVTAATVGVGSGGAAGGYTSKWIIRTPALVPTCTIGAGGVSTAGASLARNAQGGNSVYSDGVNTLTGGGGLGGVNGNPTSNMWPVGFGSYNTTGVGTGGDINAPGEIGESGWEAGTGVAPGVNAGAAGNGGSSRFGSGGWGVTGGASSAAAFGATGYAGQGSGAGGGGGCVGGGALNYAGGNGAPGCVVITEYR